MFPSTWLPTRSRICEPTLIADQSFVLMTAVLLPSTRAPSLARIWPTKAGIAPTHIACGRNVRRIGRSRLLLAPNRTFWVARGESASCHSASISMPWSSPIFGAAIRLMSTPGAARANNRCKMTCGRPSSLDLAQQRNLGAAALDSMRTTQMEMASMRRRQR